MTCYIVSFEPASGEGVEAIHARLQTIIPYCPINKYCWAVMTDKTAPELRDYLSSAAPSARLFVIRSGVAAAWRNPYSTTNSDWLKKNL
jgi:hypothetical protein